VTCTIIACNYFSARRPSAFTLVVVTHRIASYRVVSYVHYVCSSLSWREMARFTTTTASTTPKRWRTSISYAKTTSSSNSKRFDHRYFYDIRRVKTAGIDMVWRNCVAVTTRRPLSHIVFNTSSWLSTTLVVRIEQSIGYVRMCVRFQTITFERNKLGLASWLGGSSWP